MGLDVYLSDKRIGVLSRAGEGGCAFAYAPELVEEVAAAEGTGPLPLSRSLPVRAEPYGPAETRPYIEGLLPEGARRETIAGELCVDPEDSYALVAALGRDCPGAVVFLPEGEPPPARDPSSLAWLTGEELEQLALRPERGLIDPANEQRMRFALPGTAHKLALVRSEAGNRWAWPTAGVPSTHILKPAGEEPVDLAINRMACTTGVRKLGLPAAETELVEIGGLRCLVARRFDRRGEGVDAVRLHMESFPQALGFAPGSEEARRLGYRRSWELLREADAEEDMEALFAFAFCKYLLGHDESPHGRDAALLHGPEGTGLAPFCDFASPSPYRSREERKPRSIPLLMDGAASTDELAPGVLDCEPELQPMLWGALREAARLSDALYDAGEQAKMEGWYSRLIAYLPPRTNPFDFIGFSDFD